MKKLLCLVLLFLTVSSALRAQDEIPDFATGLVQNQSSGQAWYVVIFFLLSLWIYFYIAWRFVGRDPEKRVVRQYAPPEDVSPALARYLTIKKYDEKNFAVILISLSLKGAIKITKDPVFWQASDNDPLSSALLEGPYVIHPQKRNPMKPLSKEEQAVYNSLFEEKDQELRLSKGNITKISSADWEAQQALESFDGKFRFSNNFLWVIPAIIPLGVFFSNLTEFGPESKAFGLFAVFFACCAAWLFSVIVKVFKKYKLSITSFFITFLLLGLSALIFKVVANASSFLVMSVWGSPTIADILWYASGIAICIASCIVFIWVIKTYSAEVRAMLDQIEGFKEYLSSAEARRTAVSDPTDAQKMFCDYFAYAIALDVENEWTDSFKDALGTDMIDVSLAEFGIEKNDIRSSSGIMGLKRSLSDAASRDSNP